MSGIRKDYRYAVYKDFCIYDDRELFGITSTRLKFNNEGDAAACCVKKNLADKLFDLLDKGFAHTKIHHTRMFKVIEQNVLLEAMDGGLVLSGDSNHTVISFYGGIDYYGYGAKIIDMLFDNQVVCFEIY